MRTLSFIQFGVDRSSDQAFWLTSDGRFFYLNDAACDSLGYSRDELLTMSVPEINPTCPPDEFPPLLAYVAGERNKYFRSLTSDEGRPRLSDGDPRQSADFT